MPLPDFDSLPPEVVTALQSGNKLEAVKLMKEKTGLGLLEAKEALERAMAYEPEFEPSTKQHAPGEQSSTPLWIKAGFMYGKLSMLAIILYVIYHIYIFTAGK